MLPAFRCRQQTWIPAWGVLVVDMQEKKSHGHFLMAGILATAFFGVGKGLLVRWGVDGDICDLILIPPVLLVLFVCFKEPANVGVLSLAMTVTGLLAGLLYYAAYYSNQTVHIESPDGLRGVFVYIIGSAVLIPLFEEKVVRQLLFFGLSNYMNPLLSGLVVSAAFGLAHRGNIVFATAFSIAMCFLAAKGVGTLNRAALHGSFNLALNAMLVNAGYSSS